MYSAGKHEICKKIFFEYLLTALTAMGTILIIRWLLKYSTYGLDFTDESFYLVWIANPFIYSGSLSQFGFVYHPLYILLNSDIAALRQANILITYGLTWSLAYIFLAELASCVKGNRIILLAVSAGLATSSFILFATWWLPTPSYNSLTLQSLLITAIGLILADKNTPRSSGVGGLLIGVGGWFSFMAKPSTAAVLAICVFIYLLLARKFSIRLFVLIATSVLVLLFISALLIDGSLIGFIKRYQLGFEYARNLLGANTFNAILRIDNFQLDKHSKIGMLLIFSSLFIALWSIITKHKKLWFIGILFSILFFAITSLLTFGQIHRSAELNAYQGLILFALTYAMVAIAYLFGGLRSLKAVSTQQWAIFVFFLAMPHIYAFGTGNNYWLSGSAAAVFWLLAGLTLLGPLIRIRASLRFILPIALAAQAVTAILLQTGLEHPYRQPQPLRLNTSVQKIGLQRSTLLLSKGYADYISSVVSVAQKGKFESNTPIIDLTGQSPGILFAMKAMNIGHAWTLGGYPGSFDFVKAGLLRFSCEEISRAWVLLEPQGPRPISSEIMREIGADFPAGFVLVGSWQTAEGASGNEVSREQLLFKPISPDETFANCKTMRGER